METLPGWYLLRLIDISGLKYLNTYFLNHLRQSSVMFHVLQDIVYQRVRGRGLQALGCYVTERGK